MDTHDRIINAPRESEWRWPREPVFSQSVPDRALGLPCGVADNAGLRRAVIDDPNDDAPREAYGAWMAAQQHDFAKLLGAFIAAQLRVAQAFRTNRRADVSRLRRWRDNAYVSTAQFRAGDVLRHWFLDDLSPLISQGLIGWPQIYRGFVERVGVRARRFLEIAEELFELAPIRHLVVIGVPEVVDALADCRHLARVRSLSLPRYRQDDDLTDETLQRLLASPHLTNLVHLRLVHQQRVTLHGFENVVTAATLPQLSSFEVFTSPLGSDHLQIASFDPRGRTERMITYDTANAAIRAQDWVDPIEHEIGYVPCLHPEDYYGRETADIEAVIENPIGCDAQVMARRGRLAPEMRKRRTWRR